mmetsp:Transcript_16619/g.53333  ORF Transcript_16619/g.53333 Transcript_16619/m.53333 type:complete len:386 (-) Transcript_16619:1083-2240(-)
MAPSAYRETGSAHQPSAGLSKPAPGFHGPCSMRSYQKCLSSSASSSPTSAATCTAHTASSAEWNPRFEPSPCGQKGSRIASPTGKTGSSRCASSAPAAASTRSRHSRWRASVASTKPACTLRFTSSSVMERRHASSRASTTSRSRAASAAAPAASPTASPTASPAASPATATPYSRRRCAACSSSDGSASPPTSASSSPHSSSCTPELSRCISSCAFAFCAPSVATRSAIASTAPPSDSVSEVSVVADLSIASVSSAISASHLATAASASARARSKKAVSSRRRYGCASRSTASAEPRPGPAPCTPSTRKGAAHRARDEKSKSFAGWTSQKGVLSGRPTMVATCLARRMRASSSRFAAVSSSAEGRSAQRTPLSMRAAFLIVMTM